MTEMTASMPRRLITPWRIAGWGLIAILLALPAILRFPWTASDFVLAAVMLGTVGAGIEFLARLSGNVFVRLGGVVMAVTCFLTIWVNLAVGMIGDDNPYNLLFLGVLAVAVGGTLMVRYRAAAMVKVTLACAVLQVVVGLGGYGMDPRGAIFSAFFGLFWLIAAALFAAGARR
ncbi:hypothetical protein [Sphingomonas humi]|uniref:Acid-resistance membrane protein n=1 Tax=Sphingomonas humi TaxID=335630 RepID=A0ABP7S4C1_9SPHN